MGSVLDQGNKVGCNLFAGGGYYLQFVEKATPVKCNQAKHSNMRCAHMREELKNICTTPDPFTQ